MVLIVEDHKDLQDILSRIVNLIGYPTITARNGREGVEKALEETPSLILMDILMPEMDGRQAARIIRSNPGTRSIPILAATVLSRDSEIKSCLDAGCDDCIVKPFSLQQLREKIQRFMSTPGPANN